MQTIYKLCKNDVCHVALLFFFVLKSTIIQAQQKQIDFNIPSPNASALGVYGEMPVSYFTGIPSISIPIYMIKGNKIQIPIEMSYYASGLRPDNHPSYVGNGWNLSTGGAITRKANGQIDEYYRASTGKQGYYYNYNSLNNGNWANNAGLNQSIVYPMSDPGSSPVGQYIDVDTEPDEFDFNFLGFSGKFFLDQTGQWRVQSEKPIKVIFNNNDLIKPFIGSNAYPSLTIDVSNVSATFGKFTLIDGEGNQYVFGSPNPASDPNNTGIEFGDVMIPSGGRGTSFTANSWFLTRIISADGMEVINLNYERGPFTSYIGYSISSSQIIGQPGDFLNPGCVTSSNGKHVYSGRIISPVYLASIDMPSQDLRINFVKSKSDELDYELDGHKSGAYARVYNDAGQNPTNFDFPSFYLDEFKSPNLIPYFQQNPPSANFVDRFVWLKLDNMEIVNTATDQKLKSIFFSYFNNSQKRLQLNNINIEDRIGTIIEKYTFGYNQTALPKYLVTYTDHWGFNNNVAQPQTSYNFNLLRAPDPTGTLTQAEILTDIVYPTGGRTNFQFEPNTYSSVIKRDQSLTASAENGIAGGLRIKKISNNDARGNLFTKEYFYVNQYSPGANPSSLPSSGVLDSQPTYNFTVTGVDLNNVPYTYSSVSSTSVVPLTSSSSGSFIGYTNVVEKRSDGAYSSYNFTNHDNGYVDLAAVNSFNRTTLNYLQWTSLGYTRGKLLRKADYNANNVLVAENINTYTGTNTGLYAHAVLTGRVQVCQSGNRIGVSRTAYQIPYYPFVNASSTQNNFDLNGVSIASLKTDYEYDQYKNPVMESFINSKGILQRKLYKYAYQFTGGTANNLYLAMSAQNINSIPIEIQSTKIINGVEYLIDGEVKQFKRYNNNSYYPDAVYTFESDSQIPLNSLTATAKDNLTDGGLTLDTRYKIKDMIKYDSRGNLSTVIAKGNLYSSYIWDYNQSKVVAKIINSSINNGYLEAAYTSFEYDKPTSLNFETGYWSGINLANITAGGLTGRKYYQLNGNTLTKGNLVPGKSYTVSYWSKNGPCQVSGSTATVQGETLATGWTHYQHKVSNVSSVTINGNTAIDELRLYPAEAAMTTYTYNTLAGLTSTTDQKQRIEYYEYDDFQRLKNVLDMEGNLLRKNLYNYGVPEDKPVILNVSVVGKTIFVNYFPVSGCYSTTIQSTDLTTMQVKNSTSGCNANSITVDTSGRTYRIVEISYSSTYPGGKASDPVDVYVP